MKSMRHVDFPTVLIAELDNTTPLLLRLLRGAGYNVLVAHDWDSTIRFITTHSRPIHILLTNADRAGSDVARVQKLRPALDVFFVSQMPERNNPDVLDPASAFAAVSKILPAQKPDSAKQNAAGSP